MRREILVCWLVLVSTMLFGQIGFHGELRPRAEFRDGYKVLSQPELIPALFVSQRSRLGLSWAADKVESRIVVQDVRVWGDESLFSATGVTGDPGSIDLFEGWLKFAPGKDFFIKVGRQEWDIYDTRLISIRNWNQTGVVYDGALIGLTTRIGKINAGVSWNNDRENSFGNLYSKDKMKTLDFVYWKVSPTKVLDINVLFVLSGFQKENTETLFLKQTVGGGLDYFPGNLSIRITPYYQFGLNRSGQPVSAWFLSGRAEQSLGTLRILGGFDILSGQARQGDTGTDRLFDLLYGNRHGYLGFKDYFNNIPQSTGGAGLVDFYLKIEKAWQGSSIQAWYHNFRNQTTVFHGNERLDKLLGHEIDLVFRQKFTPNFSLESGYGFMIPTETFEYLNSIEPGGSDFSHFLYMMLVVKW